MLKLEGKVHSEWYKFGEALGLQKSFLDTLNGYPEIECMVELIDHWLRNHPDKPTWKEIADALEDINEYKLASSINAVYEGTSKLHLQCD